MKIGFLIKVKNKFLNLERRFYLWRKRVRLKNKTPTIIANNCTAGVMYHDLGLKFNSPTVNLYFKAEDFLRFVENLESHLSLELEETESDLPYPVGMLGDVKIYFMHYKSFEEAKAKWEERSKRVDYDNIYIVMSEKEGFAQQLAEGFENLKYENKVLLTHRPMPQIKSSYYIRGFEDKEELGVTTDFKNSFLQRRYIDDFDYAEFLNTGKIKQ